MILIYENIPCPILLKEEPDTFLILFKGEQKWIYQCSYGYGKIKKDEYGKCYLFNGVCHREYDKPSIIIYNYLYKRCEKYWNKNGFYHREEGPAMEFSDGERYWYKNGLRHRLDGPAIECPNGHKEWRIEGRKYSEKEYYKKLEEIKKIYGK